MVNKRKLFSRIDGEKTAEDVLHSSGFAQVQNQHYGSEGCSGNLGSFVDQRAADARRRYIKGYQNARLVQGAYTAERARKYVPRTDRRSFSGGTLGSRRDTSGDGFSGSMIGQQGGSRRIDTPAAPAAPTRDLAFRPDFKPKFN